MEFDEEEFKFNCKLLSDGLAQNILTLEMFNKTLSIKKLNFILILQYDQEKDIAYQGIASSCNDDKLLYMLNEAKRKVQSKIDLLKNNNEVQH